MRAGQFAVLVAVQPPENLWQIGSGYLSGTSCRPTGFSFLHDPAARLPARRWRCVALKQQSVRVVVAVRRSITMSEVYFCGKCRRQQQPSQGERCIMCGRITVSWYTGRESEDDAMRKWRSING
ncbi:hypothetical protein OHA72_48960 [Dactylosporangium sp. NBC_01737]|uniref:hypothetical protein n=1 Tax=Dactylosporangium sp. NBC_01737 TaxID=2975959 RepID=UPI002E15B259|nr:hypothetical protein OHA72_48960 [Dactylosporangium sp. NBC_01737]